MLEWGTDFFEQKAIPDPRHSIEWLLAETLNIKRLDLYLKYDRPLSPDELNTLRPLVKRRAGHEPLQYITGYTDFMNARITVNEHVLIPRLETEQLVEIILDKHPAGSYLSVIDLGTGSGCIPIALKMERPQWTVSGIDNSVEALELARENANSNEVDISLWKDDMLSPQSIEADSPIDIIVSNPPYVNTAEKESLEPQVREFEPPEALFFDDLEKMYGSIIQFAKNNLSQDGYLYLELHEDYSDKILELFEDDLWSASIEKDYDSKPRFIIAERR